MNSILKQINPRRADLGISPARRRVFICLSATADINIIIKESHYFLTSAIQPATH